MSATPDRATALAFVALLAGDAGATVTLQLKRDAAGGNRRLAVHHWSLDDDKLWAHLVWENEHGIAIYIMVNAGDLKGRSAINVLRLRALFVDDDKGQLPPGSAALLALPPSFSVRSKNGCHHYWLLGDGEDLQRFTAAQRTLASHLGTDPNVSDLPRVMRVPGFLHMKTRSDPFPVTLIPGTGTRHSIDDVVRAYPPSPSRPPQPVARPRRHGPGRHTAASPPGEARALVALSLRHPLIRWARANPNDVRYRTWLGIASNLAAAGFGDVDALEQARVAFHDISKDHDGYSFSECEALWRSVSRAPLPVLFANLDDAPEDVCVGGVNLVSAVRSQLRSLR